MNRIQFCCICATLSLAACVDDTDTSSMRKGEVDAAAFEGTVAVTVDGELGTVLVPFTIPVPDVDDHEFEDALEGAVSLVVSNPRSGVTANLASGRVVDGSPSAPGEYTWELNDARDQATLSFFNATTSGLSLDVGADYSAFFALATNDYVSAKATTAFDIEVTP